MLRPLTSTRPGSVTARCHRCSCCCCHSKTHYPTRRQTAPKKPIPVRGLCQNCKLDIRNESWQCHREAEGKSKWSITAWILFSLFHCTDYSGEHYLGYFHEAAEFDWCKLCWTLRLRRFSKPSNTPCLFCFNDQYHCGDVIFGHKSTAFASCHLSRKVSVSLGSLCNSNIPISL